MPKKSNVDVWLGLETEHKRKALENASRHFDGKDALTVNTLEAVYGQESSFGTNIIEERGITEAAGHFQLEKATAKEYGLTITKDNDQRFDIDDSSYVAAKYLKDLNRMFGKRTVLTKDRITIPVKNVVERKKFALAAYNGGQGRIAKAQQLALQTGKNPQLWNDVKKFLKLAKASTAKVKEICEFIEKVLQYEVEFDKKSPADKTTKKKTPKKPRFRCTGGRWRTIDDQKVMICD